MATDEPRTAAQRRHTAYEEAGHGVVALVFGAEVQFLSIRPGASHWGIAKSRVPDDRRVDLSSVDGDALLADPAARLAYERAITATLAGEAAADLGDMQTGRLEDPAPPPAAVAAAEALATLAPRHRSLLFDLEAREDLPADSDRAWDFSYALAGQEANLHVAWLTEVARRMVREYWAQIAAVAERLLEVDVLSGADAAAIVKEVANAQAIST